MDLRRRIVAEFEKGAGRHDDPAVCPGQSIANCTASRSTRA